MSELQSKDYAKRAERMFLDGFIKGLAVSNVVVVSKSCQAMSSQGKHFEGVK